LVLGVLVLGAVAGADLDGEVIPEIVRMLEAEVAEDVIVRWLDHDARVVATLSSDDVIALSNAGASTTLIKHLMAQADDPPEPASQPVPQAMPDDAPAPPSRQVPALPSPVAEPVTPVATPDGKVPVEFAVHYRTSRDPDLDEDEQWHLFVYLDGQPLVRSDGKNWLTKSKRVVEITQRLDPGHHVVRLVQEKHARRGGKWFHEARACPEPIEFTTAAEQRLEIEIVEGTGIGMARRRTYRWSASSGPAASGDLHPLTGPTSDWPRLCEEVESNIEGKQKVPRYARRQLDGCVRWTDLWPDVEGLLARNEVRAQLERADFRPSPPTR
jgi:hypothetical protein